MKRISLLIISLIIYLLSIDSIAQPEAQQSVERYLYTYYNSNKSSLRETERIIRFLEERMDLYLVTLSREGMKSIKSDDAVVDDYVKQMERITNIRMVRQTIEEGRVGYREVLDRLINEGISSREDVLNCRKILVLKSMEINLINSKQDKLLILLKDDYLRGKFLQEFVASKSEKDLTNLRSMTKQVDLAIDVYEI